MPRNRRKLRSKRIWIFVDLSLLSKLLDLMDGPAATMDDGLETGPENDRDTGSCSIEEPDMDASSEGQTAEENAADSAEEEDSTAQATGGWWKELELEEMRQDLAAARQLRHDQTEQLASGGPYATADTKTENGTEEETENKAQKEPDEGGQAGCLPGKAPPSDRHQHYADTLAWERWYTEAPLRVVNYSLGFPVVVEEPDGYPKPPAGSCVAIAQHSAEVCAASLSISAVFLHSAFNFWNFSLRRCAKQRSDGCQAARRSIPPSIRSRGRADAVA